MAALLRNVLLVYVLVLCSSMSISSKLSAEGFAEVLSGLNWKRINIAAFSTRLCKEMSMRFSFYDVMSSCHQFTQMNSSRVTKSPPYWLLIYPDLGLLQSHFEANPIPFTTIVLLESHGFYHSWNQAVNSTRGFFQLAQSGHSERHYLLASVVTLSNSRGEALTQWNWPQHELFFQENFDLKGLELNTINLSFPPWIMGRKCGKRFCDPSGIGVSVINVITSQYNFTLSYDYEESNVWGTAPLDSEWSDEKPNFVGIMRKILEGEYDLCPCTWIWNLDRHKWADFTMQILNTPYDIYIGPGDMIGPLDLTMFLRPFNTESWLVILAHAAGILVLVVLLKWVMHKQNMSEDDLWSSRMLIFLIWLGFLLLDAFYGGALTMFFSSKPTLPFRSLSEAVQRYPEWKGKVLVASEELVFTTLSASREEQAFRDRIKKRDEGVIATTATEAIEWISTEPNTFFYCDELHMQDVLSRGPTPRVRKIGLHLGVHGSFMLSKNHPLTKVLNLGIAKVRQSGALGAIIKAEVPSIYLSNQQEGQKETLTLNQFSLLFFLFLAALTTSLMLFLVELMWSRMYPQSYVFNGEAYHQDGASRTKAFNAHPRPHCAI